MQVGEVVGSYRITGRLGAGGMGVVYLAEHTLLGREAAIKVLLPQFSNDEGIVARFFNEAKATTSIKHPGIVEVFDFGYAGDGSAYLVMERLEGESLGERLRRDKQLPLEQALGIARQVAGALGAAHKLGIVHRDLKPDNIFMVADTEVSGGERAKVLDFGIAKLRDGGEVGFETQEGTLMGAPLYMAPEQCTGARDVDHRADLYSLGCILFELLCGKTPFAGRAYAEVLASQVRSPPPRPRSIQPSIPAAVEAIILRLLEKSRESRFGDAAELMAAIHEASGQFAPQLPPFGTPYPGEGVTLEPPSKAPASGSPFESVQDYPAVHGPGFSPGMSGVVSSASRTMAIGAGGAPANPQHRSKRTASGQIPILSAGDLPAPAQVAPGASRGRAERPSAAPPATPRRSAVTAEPPRAPQVTADPPGAVERPLYEVRRRGADERVVVTSEGERRVGPASAPAAPYSRPPAVPPAREVRPPAVPQRSQHPSHQAPVASPSAPTLAMAPVEPEPSVPRRPVSPSRPPDPVGVAATMRPFEAAGAPRQMAQPMVSPGGMPPGMSPPGMRQPGMMAPGTPPGMMPSGVHPLAVGQGSAWAQAPGGYAGHHVGGASGATRPGRLGLVVVLLALVVGGGAAYFIATSDDLDEAAPLPTTAALEPTAPVDPPPTAAPLRPTDPEGNVAIAGDAAATASAVADAAPAVAVTEALDAGGETAAPAPGAGDAGVAPVDPETNRRPAALVSLRIDSSPHGAQIIREADGVRLGETPFVYEVEPQAGSVTFLLRHDGYAEEVVNMPSNRSGERKVSLTRSTGADRAPSLKD